MKNDVDLKRLLQSVDHKSYPAYKSLKGEYRFPEYVLSVDHVQGDPFAAPSALSVCIPAAVTRYPEKVLKDGYLRNRLADFLLRSMEEAVRKYTFRAKGSGKSGLIAVSHCGQEILERTACRVTPKETIVRFAVGFPARGRTIDAGELQKILFDFLPSAVAESFFYRNLNQKALDRFLRLSEDQRVLRGEIRSRNLVAFVRDGAVLPRESGVSSRPMKEAKPFISPDSMAVTIELPNEGTVRGMGIPKGITLIVGGGYHGKSTLLDALSAGVYDHIPGDGREYVVTDETALFIRSEDGRFIKDTDISLFINSLPDERDTTSFCTQDASGSTSQAAGVVEGMEAGCRVLLMDEDTSATNFMVRDSFMQRVIAKEKEPITPFLARARDLYEKAGISTILVAGSSGAFFHIADHIIQMDRYLPVDITESTKKLLDLYPLEKSEADAFFIPESRRIMTRPAPEKTRKNYYGDTVERTERLKIKVHGRDGFSIGKQEVDLRCIEQIVDSEQTAALAYLLRYACERLIDGRKTLDEVIAMLNDLLSRKGTDFFTEGDYVASGYALPRILEIYSCFLRFRRP